MIRSLILILFTIFSFELTLFPEKWQGRIFKDGNITVVENRG